MTDHSTMSFEEAMEKLEEIVQQLEEEDLPLEEALKQYEAGIRYYDQCDAILKKAKQKIETYRRKEEK